MSSVVTVFNPATTSETSFTAPNSAANGALVFFNESNISLILNFADGSNMYLPAWYHRHKCGATGSVKVDWTVHAVLLSNPAPISEIIVEAFDAGEPFPADGPLVRQTNGEVNSNIVGGAASNITNVGNAPGENLINAQPSDASLATWTADTQGNLLIRADNAGVLTTLLQLIAGANPNVQIMGGPVVDTSGHIIMKNNINLKWDDASGNSQLILALTSGNQVRLRAGALGAGVFIGDQDNTTMLEVSNNGAGIQLGRTTAGDAIDQTSGGMYIKSIAGGFIFQCPAGTDVAKLDASGNLIIKGTLTQNGTP